MNKKYTEEEQKKLDSHWFALSDLQKNIVNAGLEEHIDDYKKLAITGKSFSEIVNTLEVKNTVMNYLHNELFKKEMI